MKTLQFSYDLSFEPPAPVMEISLLQPNAQEEAKAVQIRGLVDSGADITVVPQWVINQLGLYPVDEVLVAGYSGQANPAWLYSVAVTTTEFKPQIIRVVAAVDVSVILIGRDIINKWILLLDGKQQVLKITD